MTPYVKYSRRNFCLLLFYMNILKNQGTWKEPKLLSHQNFERKAALNPLNNNNKMINKEIPSV